MYQVHPYPLHQVPHGGRIPAAIPRGHDPTRIQFIGDALQCRQTSRPYVFDYRQNVLRVPIRVRLDRRDGRLVAKPTKRLGAIRVTEDAALPLGRLHGIARALADDLTLMLSDGREEVNGQLVCVWHISAYEAHSALLQIRDKPQITREPIELRDHQRCARHLGAMQRLGELRAIIALASFHFHELTNELRVALLQERRNCGSLRFEPEPAVALPLRAHPQIGHEFAGCHGAALSILGVISDRAAGAWQFYKHANHGLQAHFPAIFGHFVAWPSAMLVCGTRPAMLLSSAEKTPTPRRHPLARWRIASAGDASLPRNKIKNSVGSRARAHVALT